MKKIAFVLAALFSFFSHLLQADEAFSSAGDTGKFINPISDVCWSCLFPIHIMGENVTKKEKPLTEYSQKLVCSCPGGVVGIPLAFWEPTRLIDVTRTPYKLVGLGGIQVGKNSKKGGGVFGMGSSENQGFYHVHYYQFPILSLLEVFGDFLCVEDFPLDIGYLSELDPFWMNDQWTSILAPETALFGSPVAQLACIPDCLTSTFGKPKDQLFWCAGCQGNLYPLTGFIGHHSGLIRSSSLLVHRILAKLHKLGLLKTFPKDDYCCPKPSRFIKKAAYKTQLAYPVAQTESPCNPLGKSTLRWGAFKSYPYKGEDFTYVIWTKKHCCLDPIKMSESAAGAVIQAGQTVMEKMKEKAGLEESEPLSNSIKKD
jgi:conjugal transfer pilus assembly protein TraU